MERESPDAIAGPEPKTRTSYGASSPEVHEAAPAQAAQTTADAGQNGSSDSENDRSTRKIKAELQTLTEVVAPQPPVGGSPHATSLQGSAAAPGPSSVTKDAVAPSVGVAEQIASAEPEVSKPATAAFHAEHLTEQMSGPELQFIWHSPESGDIQLSTSLHQRDVQMTVNTERADTANAIRAELPTLDGRLHEHSLQLGEVSIVAHERSVSTGMGMAGQQQGNREWNAPGRTSVRMTVRFPPKAMKT